MKFTEIKKNFIGPSIGKLESKIDELLRDERVLHLVSKNINVAVDLQKKATNRLEYFLSFADVPTLKGLNDLFKSVNDLEKVTMSQKEEIRALKKEIEELKRNIRVEAHTTFEPKPIKRSGTLKKS